MNSISYGQVDLWSQEAMIYYLMFLVIGSIVTSHITEALHIILNRAQDAEQRAAKQRLKQSTKRYKELTHAYSSTGQHESGTHRPDPRRTEEEDWPEKVAGAA